MNHSSQVEALFFEALEQKTADERAAFLESACGGDVELRRQVEKLLDAHPMVGDFLKNPVAEQLAATPDRPDYTQQLGPSTDEESAATPLHPERTRTLVELSDEDDASALQFLLPSTRPGALGRIGHYDVLEVLGKGGFGIVFRAFDEVLQRVVAVKVLAPQMAATSPARKRFLREARSSAQVRHDNVVQVYAVEEQPVPYLVMEYIPGETLQQRLDREGPLDVPHTVRVAWQIAEGLAAAHATGLIHRDIKPSNMLIEKGPQERVKITDFGLARAADDASLTRSGVVAGTPMYMAPEQAAGESFDHRADLFSLGSVLYVMATGRPPFRASTTFAVLKRVAEDEPRPIREVIPEVPEWLCGIVTKLHAKDPVARFQTAREVAELLADCEAKLKAHQEVKNVVPAPAVKSTVLAIAPAVTVPPAARGRKLWGAAAAVVVLLPVIALAVTEFAGVPHLFRSHQPTPDPIKPRDLPAPIQLAKGGGAIETGDAKKPFAPKYALRFEAKDDAVHVANSISVDLRKAVTLEAWVKFHVAPSVANRKMAVVTQSMFRNDLDLQAETDDRFHFFVGIGYSVQSKTVIETGKWYHVAVTYAAADKIEIFVNGQLECTRPISLRLDVNSNPVTIGSGGEVWQGRELNGLVGGVRVSGTVRYTKDFTPETRFKAGPDTVDLFHFDEGEGDLLKDSSGNGHHGKIVGAKWVTGDGSAIAPNATPDTERKLR